MFLRYPRIKADYEKSITVSFLLAPAVLPSVSGPSHNASWPAHQGPQYDPSVQVSTQEQAITGGGGGGGYPLHYQYQQQAAPVLPTLMEESSSRHPDSDASVPENELIQGIDQDMWQAQVEVHKMFDVAEESVGDTSYEIPYDPNLTCPKCGKQFHRGEIQRNTMMVAVVNNI